MQMNWKKTLLMSADILLAIYLVIAITAWNNPDQTNVVCQKVNIDISDSNNAGFLSANEIKKILSKERLYPLNKSVQTISPRKIEDALKRGPFVKTAQCYVSIDGEVNISITQRMPLIHIKSQQGHSYYVDELGGILPNSQYSSDLIIATGKINPWFATNIITPLAKTISKNKLWLNQIEQIHVRPNYGIELIPRMGDHIVFIGKLPYKKLKQERDKEIEAFVSKKLTRLEKFYRYGLSQAGWNKYTYINIEFDNQIICTKKDAQLATESTSPLPEENKKKPTDTPHAEDNTNTLTE